MIRSSRLVLGSRPGKRSSMFLWQSSENGETSPASKATRSKTLSEKSSFSMMKTQAVMILVLLQMSVNRAWRSCQIVWQHKTFDPTSTLTTLGRTLTIRCGPLGRLSLCTLHHRHQLLPHQPRIVNLAYDRPIHVLNLSTLFMILAHHSATCE
jgi:hypothetical protein